MSRRLVVHVPRRLTHSAWGGTERVLEQTLPLLRGHGYEAAIYTSQALDSRVVDTLGEVPVSRFPYFYPEWPLSASRRLRYDHKGGNTVSPALARSLAEVSDLSLVHCHTGNILGAQCLRQARARGVPTVLTLHGGHFAIPQAEMQSLSQRAGALRRRSIPLGRVLSLALDARNLVRNVDALVCVGVEEYEAARAALPQQRVEFLPGGVNMEAFSRADAARGHALLGSDPTRALVVCIARVDHQKDQATLVRAWAHHTGADCDLAIVGPETTEGYMDELRELARGARGKLFMPGGLPPEEAPHLYAAGRISVLPSRHEPFGLTCLESWAARTALICADVGGPAWLLAGEREGLLYPAGEAAALGQRLDTLLDDAAQRTRLVDAGFARVGEEFTWAIRAQRLAALYESLREAPPRPR